MRKPTQLQGSDNTLIEPLYNFICKCQGDHGHPTGMALRKMQEWTWTFARSVVDGICKVIRKKYNRTHATRRHQHPVAAAQTEKSIRMLVVAK